MDYQILDDEKLDKAQEEVLLESKATDVESPSGEWTWDLCLVFSLGSETKKVYAEVTREERKVFYIGKKSKKRKWRNRVIENKDWHYADTLGVLKHEHEQTEASFFQNEISLAIDGLKKAGLELMMYQSVQADELYVLVGAKEGRLQNEAERIGYELELDVDGCIEAGMKKNLLLAHRTTSDDPLDEALTRNQWTCLYGPYVVEKDKAFPNLYKRYPSDYATMGDGPIKRNQTLFTTITRLKLIRSIIEAEVREGGAGLSLRTDRVYPLQAQFPLHTRDKLKKLEEVWGLTKATFAQPLNAVRDYFGEHVALYFGFLQLYNRWLLLPSLFGLIAFIVQVTEDLSHPIIIVFGFFMAVWSTVLLEVWKRQQAAYRADWGMSNFGDKERPRPEFSGVWQPSLIDGRIQEIFPYEQQLKRRYLSQAFIWVMILIVLGAVVSIFIFRNVLMKINQTWGGIVAGVVNAVQIQVMNFFYGKAALYLNDWENHRTQTEYDNALISKSFLFKFVNNYNTLFYIAFFKRFDVAVEGCATDDPDCLSELQVQLGTVFVTMLVMNNVLEIGTPYFRSRNKAIQNADLRIGVEHHQKSTPEKEAELDEYESTFADFDEIVIQYGYATLFVVAFPLCPLLALLNNFVEQRLDSFKLCQLTRRPHPRGASDIGTWYYIIEIISILSVITNSAIVMFVSDAGDYLSGSNLSYKFLIFLIAEHAILLVKTIVAAAIPDEPEDITEHLRRQTHIVDVIISDAEEEREPSLEGDEERKVSAVDFKNLQYAENMKQIQQHMPNPSLGDLFSRGHFAVQNAWLECLVSGTLGKSESHED